ncbi:MAG: hypothetical protein IID33_12130 [Planctomycetes bacterium]|nr:hypothetical protein [Planctomycetota bacterium]
MIANVLLKIAFVSTISLADGTVDKPPTVVTSTDEPQVMIEMRLVQINVSDSSAVPVISDLPLVGKGAEPKATPRGGSGETVGTGWQGTRRTSESGFKAIDGSLNMVVAARDWELRIGELVLHVRGDEIKAVAGAEEGTKPWEIVTAPRLLFAVGQATAVYVGRTVPFLMQRDDGSLVLAPYWTERDDGSLVLTGPAITARHDGSIVVPQHQVFEGIHFWVRVDQANDEVVTIKELRLKISKLVGRVPIEGVPFDVGRPIMQNTEASMSLRLKPDQTAVIALPRDESDQPPIFMMLKARLIRR